MAAKKSATKSPSKPRRDLRPEIIQSINTLQAFHVTAPTHASNKEMSGLFALSKTSEEKHLKALLQDHLDSEGVDYPEYDENGEIVKEEPEDAPDADQKTK